MRETLGGMTSLIGRCCRHSCPGNGRLCGGWTAQLVCDDETARTAIAPAYLSTHPAPDTRIRSLEELIQRNGYNRYAFEGVKRHAEVKKQLRQVPGG